jgi:hypothetical protein
VTEEEEVVERADSKIRVVSGPPPPRDLWHLIEQLEAAAAAEDTARVLSLLKIAVPTYSGSLDTTLQAAS